MEAKRQRRDSFACDTRTCVPTISTILSSLAAVVVVAAAIAGTSFRVAAADRVGALMSGDELWITCREPDASSGYCGGYVSGVADSLTADRPVPVACISRQVTAVQLIDAVINYLAQHSAARHFGAFEVIDLALRPVYACARLQSP